MLWIIGVIILLVGGVVFWAANPSLFTTLVRKIKVPSFGGRKPTINVRLAIEIVVAIIVVGYLYFKISSGIHWLTNSITEPFESSKSWKDWPWMTIGIVTFSIVVLSLIVMAATRKRGPSSTTTPSTTTAPAGPSFGSKVWEYIKMIVIGLIAWALANALWWSVDDSSFLKWMAMPAFWIIPVAIIFKGLIAANKDNVSRNARELLSLGLAGAGLVIVMGFYRSHNKVTEPTDPSPTTSLARDRYNGPDKDYIVGRFSTTIPVLVDIAACESGFSQMDPSDPTKVLVSSVKGSSATGAFQILMKTHGDQAKSLGYNLETLEGNSDFAEWLYRNEGTTPWDKSKGCWQGGEGGQVSSPDTTAKPTVSKDSTGSADSTTTEEGELRKTDSTVSKPSMQFRQPQYLWPIMATTAVAGGFSAVVGPEWSNRIVVGPSDKFRLSWGVPDRIEYQIMAGYPGEEDIKVFTMTPGKHTFIGEPEWIRIRSIHNQITVTFVRQRIGQ